MSPVETIEGRWLYGASRHRIDGPVGPATHFHGAQDRGSSGGEGGTRGGIARDRFAIAKGELGTYGFPVEA